MLQLLLMSIETDEDRIFVENFYRTHREKLKIIAYSKLKDESLAEDCVQDVFISIINMLERFKSFPPDEQIKYIVICIKNAAIAKGKEKSRVISLTAAPTDYDNRGEYDIKDNSPDVCDILINDELKKKVRECIDSLDPIYRDVMIFRYQYQMKGKEISNSLHISEDVVRQRIKRGKEMLKRKGGKELYDLFK